MGISLPDNQRQLRTLHIYQDVLNIQKDVQHIQKDVLPYALSCLLCPVSAALAPACATQPRRRIRGPVGRHPVLKMGPVGRYS